MKIGLVIYGSLDTVSGGYLYDRHLVDYLRSAGCQVDVLSLPWRNYPTHLLDNLRLNWAQQIAQSNYDILLQDELNHPSLFILNSAIRKLTPAPIISIVHHLRSSEAHSPGLLPFYRAVEARYLQSVDGFIFNSRTTCATVHKVIGRSLPHVIAYPAADHRNPPTHDSVVAGIARRTHSCAPLRLLFVGNLIERKGLHTVLCALARLGTFNWHLHVVGSQAVDPLYSAHVHELAKSLAIYAKLTWHGRLKDEDLSHLFTTSDALVMPSYEGFGIVYLEAMACGLPVLAANTGAAPEIVSPGVNGYLVTLGDDVALAAHLEGLVNNRSQLAALAYHARRRYEEHPTWNNSMQRAHSWLCEVLTQRK